MKRGEHVDQAGWIWDLHSLADVLGLQRWIGQLVDGPFAASGESLEAWSRQELLIAIEERSALLREILAEREAGL
jgi:hypothetical protein